MGRANDLKPFQINADAFICSVLPGISHTQLQYSPGIYILLFTSFQIGTFLMYI